MTTKDLFPSGSACVLTSSGVESSVLVADALERYSHVVPIYVRNHLKWEEVELSYLKRYLRSLRSTKLTPLKILELSMQDVYEAHWSITGLKVPDAKSKDQAVYLPGRNLLLVIKAAVFCAMHDIPTLEIGVLKGNPFSDGPKPFFDKFSEVLSLSLNKPVAVLAPFSKLKKDQVISKGKGLQRELSFSCMTPKGLEHCGECNKCAERKKAFFSAGVIDRTKYKKQGL